MLGQARIYYCMARDGLLWEPLGTVSDRFKTPLTAQLVTGVMSLTLALCFPIDELAEMVLCTVSDI
jgi:APA family basic amino acid/polyamine antiporter